MRKMARFNVRCITVFAALSLSLVFAPGCDVDFDTLAALFTFGGPANHRVARSIGVLWLSPSNVIIPQGRSGTVTMDFAPNPGHRITINNVSPPPGGSIYFFQYDITEGPNDLNFSLVSAEPVTRTGDFATRYMIAAENLAPGIYRVKVEANYYYGRTEDGKQIRKVIDLDDNERVQGTLTIIIVPASTPGTLPAREIAAGAYHSLAILTDGSVWSWGFNDQGQLGDGTTSDRLIAVPVQGLPHPAVAIAAGKAHSLALLDNGTVWGWGDNTNRQITSDSVEISLEPIQAPTGVNVQAIAAGANHSIALTTSGVVLTSGANESGQLGRGYVTDWSFWLPAIIPLDLPMVAVAAGGDFTLALDEDGQVWGWGDNSSGQLGDDTRPHHLIPVDMHLFSGVCAMAAGSHHTLAIKDDGSVLAVGNNSYGQLGVEEPMWTWAITVPGLSDITAIATGQATSLALSSDGTAYAWGDNSFGQLGFPEVGSPSITSPTPIPDFIGAQAIATGSRHSLGLATGCASTWSWGDNIVGQLGDGTGQSSYMPVQVDRLGQASDIPPCVVPLSVIVIGNGRVRSSLGGINCGDRCGQSFTPGTTVELTAEPNNGWFFEAWAGDAAGTESTTIVAIDRSKNCIALFGRALFPPTASFTFSPETPLTTDRIIFDASESSDNGAIVLYQWDFNNDGVFDAVMSNATASTSFSASFVKQFWSAGTHTVRLKVRDEDGITDETTREVTVGEAEPPEHDLGDAPDSSNSIPGTVMFAYPDIGVEARFPTVHKIGSPPYGPLHRFPRNVFLGRQVTLENEADVGVDEDPNNNLDRSDLADEDQGDDGVLLPLVLPYCAQATLDYLLNIVNPPWEYLYVNVWFDWNRDGDWDDTLTCPDGTEAPEWAVQDEGLSMFLSAGTHVLTTSSFQCWHPSKEVTTDPLWMRITLSEYHRWGSMNDPNTADYGGAGPQKGYRLGETEDYLIYP